MENCSVLLGFENSLKHWNPTYPTANLPKPSHPTFFQPSPSTNLNPTNPNQFTYGWSFQHVEVLYPKPTNQPTNLNQPNLPRKIPHPYPACGIFDHLSFLIEA